MDAEKHSIFGSPEYMPPEVLRQDESGKAIDFWAFGKFWRYCRLSYSRDAYELITVLQLKSYRNDREHQIQTIEVQ